MKRAVFFTTLTTTLIGFAAFVALAACGGTSIEYRYRCDACACLDAEAGLADGAPSSVDDAGTDGSGPPDADAAPYEEPDAGPIVWRAATGFTGVPVDLRVGNDATTPRPFYVATENDGLQTSPDRGKSWSNLNAPRTKLTALGLSEGNANSIWAVADRASGTPYVFHTTDRGNEWRDIHLANPSGRDFDIATMFLQPSAGQFFGGRDPATNGAICVTGFGAGDYWTPHAVADATGSLRSITALTATRVYGAVTGGNAGSGGVYRSFNSGVSWEAANEGIDPARTKFVSVVTGDPTDPLTVWAGIDADGIVYKSTDGADTWVLTNAGIPQDAAVLSLAVRSSTEVYAGTTIGMFRTIDGGAHWRPYGLEGMRVVRFAIDPSIAAPAAPVIVAGVTSPTPGVFVHE